MFLVERRLYAGDKVMGVSRVTTGVSAQWWTQAAFSYCCLSACGLCYCMLTWGRKACVCFVIFII